MDFIFNHLKNNHQYLIICPKDIKKSLLKLFFEHKKIYDIKWLDQNEFIESHTFELTDDAHIYASLYLNKESSITKEMLTYLPYVNDEHIEQSNHINELLSLKTYLSKKDLLLSKNQFETLYKDRTIYIIGYPYKHKLFNKILKKYVYQDISLPEFKTGIKLHKYHDETDEVIHLAKDISSLILAGIPTNLIKVYTNNQTYIPYIETIFERFNLRPNFTFTKSLYAYDISKLVINYDQNDRPIAEAIKDIYEAVSKSFSQKSIKSQYIYKKFIDVLNTYQHLNGLFKDYKSLIISDIKVTKIPYDQYENGLIIGNIINHVLTENDHVFILGLNTNEIPNVSKNDDYLTDTEKEILELETSTDQSRMNKLNILDFINRSRHLTISYKELSDRKEAYPSSVIDEINRPILNNEENKNELHHSFKQDTITLKKHIDLYKTYHVYHPMINDYYGLLKEYIPKAYDNQFSPIDKELISKLLKNNETLSYSKLNTYFECPFKFLLKHMLKINKPNLDSMSLHIGNFFHDVLKDYNLLSRDKDLLLLELKNRLNTYILEKQDTLTLEQQFYLNHNIDHLSEVIIWIKEIDQRSNFKVYQTEKRVELNIDATYIKKLVGKIDKIMTLDEANKSIYIVDYKTGQADKSLDYIHKGLYAQLMFYLLFLKRTLDSPTFVGFFYQKIHNSVQKAEKEMDYLSILRKKWSLNGYQSSESRLVTEIDPEYETYKTLSHYKLKNDLTPTKASWVYQHQDLIQLIDDFEAYIKKTIDQIENGYYPVSPIQLDDQQLSKVACAYCEFKDICFVKSKDFIHTTKQKVFETEGEAS